MGKAASETPHPRCRIASNRPFLETVFFPIYLPTLFQTTATAPSPYVCFCFFLGGGDYSNLVWIVFAVEKKQGLKQASQKNKTMLLLWGTSIVPTSRYVIQSPKHTKPNHTTPLPNHQPCTASTHHKKSWRNGSSILAGNPFSSSSSSSSSASPNPNSDGDQIGAVPPQSRRPSVGPSAGMFAHPSVCPTVCPSCLPPVRPSARPSVRPFAHQTVRPSIVSFSSIGSFVRPSVRRSVRPSFHQSARPLINRDPSTHPPIHPSARSPIGPSTSQYVRPSVPPIVNQSVDRISPSIHPSARQPIRSSADQSVRPSVRPSARTSVGRSVSQSANQSARRPISPSNPSRPCRHRVILYFRTVSSSFLASPCAK